MDPHTSTRSREPPRDMQAEILKKLPFRSLARFKSVCKYWRDTIQIREKLFLQLLPKLGPEPNSKRYHRHARCYSAETTPSPSIRFLETLVPHCESSANLHFKVCSSDGLLLLHQVWGDTMLLLNPRTNEIREIPVGPGKFSCLADLGFGYDSNIGDYKIVAVDMSEQPWIFTFKSGEWRTIQGFPDSYRTKFGPTTTTTVFFRGAVHFLAWHCLFRMRYGILRFNLAGERFVDEILSIPDPKRRKLYCVFKVLEGRLSLQFITVKNKTLTLEVWAMTEYGNSDSWTQISGVPYWPYPTSKLPKAHAVMLPKAHAVMMNGDVLVGVEEGGEVFLNNLSKNVKRRLPEITDVSWLDIHTYWEALVVP